MALATRARPLRPRNREWAFSKLLGVDSDTPGITYMQVSNRQKVSGILYGDVAARTVTDSLTLALAIVDDEVETLAVQLRKQQRELQASMPTPPALPA